MKKLYYICIIALLLGIFNLPIYYYTILRIIVFTGAISVIAVEIKKDVNLLGIAFIGISILFNPVIPIYLYYKKIWVIIDLFTALLFLIYRFRR